YRAGMRIRLVCEPAGADGTEECSSPAGSACSGKPGPPARVTRGSALAADAADRVDFPGLFAGVPDVGPPPGGGDHAGRHQVEPGEEAGDPVRAAQVVRAGGVLVVDGDGL